MEKKTDRRVVKTKHAIFKAFVELLNEKDINQITITDVAKRANINRKTFYNYYSDINDVMEEIENLVVANVIKLRIDSYQGIQTKCMPFLFSLDKSPKM